MSKLTKVLFPMLLATSLLTLASMGATAHADQINTSGSICHTVDGGHAQDFDYTANAILNNATTSQKVVCPVPRPPLSSSSQTGTFFVDGGSDANTCTSCTVFVLDFFGNVDASNAFTECGGANGTDWDHQVSFSGSILTVFDYVSVTCTIPGNKNGRIRGVTAVAP